LPRRKQQTKKVIVPILLVLSCISAIQYSQYKNKQVMAPACKNGETVCQPWERDWKSSDNLQKGSTVTSDGKIILPE
jgi:hypothetical protein